MPQFGFPGLELGLHEDRPLVKYIFSFKMGKETIGRIRLDHRRYLMLEGFGVWSSGGIQR